HVGERSLEVRPGDPRERVEGVAAGTLVVRDETLLDQQPQKLFHGIRFGAGYVAEPGHRHTGVLPQRIDYAELETGQQVHESRGPAHVFAKCGEGALWCHIPPRIMGGTRKPAAFGSDRGLTPVFPSVRGVGGTTRSAAPSSWRSEVARPAGSGSGRSAVG